MTFNIINSYAYLVLPGICDPRERIEDIISNRLTIVREENTEGDLFVLFPDERRRPITNQFNAAPFCLAFIISIHDTSITGSGPAVLMQTDDGAPMLTIDFEIMFSIGESSVSFNAVKLTLTIELEGCRFVQIALTQSFILTVMQ